MKEALFTWLPWIRTLDKSRLVKMIGELGIADIEAIKKALKIHLPL